MAFASSWSCGWDAVSGGLPDTAKSPLRAGKLPNLRAWKSTANASPPASGARKMSCQH